MACISIRENRHLQNKSIASNVGSEKGGRNLPNASARTGGYVERVPMSVSRKKYASRLKQYSQNDILYKKCLSKQFNACLKKHSQVAVHSDLDGILCRTV